MRRILYLSIALMTFTGAVAQKLPKSDRKIISSLKCNIAFLAGDSLEGRRAGTPGEKKAAAFIADKFSGIGLETGSQEFEISAKRVAGSATTMSVDNSSLLPGTGFFPLSLSATASLSASFSLSLSEKGGPWFIDMAEKLSGTEENPHMNAADIIKDLAETAAKSGAAALFIFDSRQQGDSVPRYSFEKRDTVAIPVIYLPASTMALIKADPVGFHDLALNCVMTVEYRRGQNVIGCLWNGSRETIVLGAHFDHLGYGEDKNSMYTGSGRQIHNGADDNASGTSALIELAEMIKKSAPKKYNYVFAAFSGEELGLFGSKYFVENLPAQTGKINFMVNMDMVGRLNDSSRTLTVGGYGTSPQWQNLLLKPGGGIQLKFDSSGTGPSDHTSFYRKDIPVLFFFTGLHSDYHKPSDDADKINYEGEKDIVRLIYSVVFRAGSMEPLTFTKTREKAENSKVAFKVTLGIMPDYTYSGEGVRIDGVSDGKPAQKAGMVAGDIIIKINQFPTPDLQKYMETLGRFSRGDKAKIVLKRGAETLDLDIVF